MTVSGGEPMAHFKTTKRLFEIARENDIATALDTCGLVEWEYFEDIFSLTNDFLYDLKVIDKAKHHKLTGSDNARIISNLFALDELGARLHLRYPLIPGLNDSLDDLHQIAEIANRCKNVEDINIETYHPLGEDKCIRLGRKPPYIGKYVSKEEHERYIAFLKQYTYIPVL